MSSQIPSLIFVGEIFSQQMMDELLVNVVSVSCEDLLTNERFWIFLAVLCWLCIKLPHSDTMSLDRYILFHLLRNGFVEVLLWKPEAFEWSLVCNNQQSTF